MNAPQWGGYIKVVKIATSVLGGDNYRLQKKFKLILAPLMTHNQRAQMSAVERASGIFYYL
uniref:Uncharacterized protein n=1 Tax=Anguilla anguilla TaxID=7936 RepID=A0A0E9QNB0_ANGAN